MNSLLGSLHIRGRAAAPRLASFFALVAAALGVSPTAFAQTVIPRVGWTIQVDSEELTSGSWGPATPGSSVIDGNPNTFWHTEWFNAQPGFPHELQIDLGATHSLTGFRHLPRQDGRVNGRIAQYEFYVSTNGTDWGSAVASGTFANTGAETTVPFPAKIGRYVRLRALSTYDPYGFATSLAELNLLTDNQAPNGQITSPTDNITIPVGQSVTFGGSGSDPDGHTPLSYHWSFGTGSGVPDSSVQNPGAVQFNQTGSFLVTLTVTDALGQVDPTPATRTVLVQSSASNFQIPRTGWAIAHVDSQELTSGSWGPATPATSAIDGNPATFWHTEWFSVQRPFPHEIQIDMGASYHVTGFRHLPRQDGVLNGRIAQFEFYVSTDGINWGVAVASGTFANTAAESTIPSTPKHGRFVRLRALSTYDAYGFAASLAELNVLTDNQAPNGTISSPASDVTIAAGQTVTFSGSGSDPDGHLPLSYHWSFGAGSGIADSTAQNPGTLTFSTPGAYTVRFTVTDAQGQSDPTPATRTILVESGTPEHLIPRTGWTLVHVDSQESTSGSWGPATPATNILDGNPSTFWHTEWFNVQTPFPHEIRIDLGAVHNITGFRHLPRQDGILNGRISQFEFYVSADGVNWGPATASGTLPNTAAQTQVPSTPKQGRFVRFRALGTYDSYGFAASLAEFNLLTDNQAPDSTITSPASDVTINTGQTVVFAGIGSDPDQHTPLTYRWTFGSGSGVPDSTVQNPGAVQFNVPGTYTVRLVATDSRGQADPTPATRTVTVSNSTPVFTIPRQSWSIAYVDSQELKSGSWGPATPATSAIDGNPSTFWHTEWFAAQPTFPHEIQIDLGVPFRIAGFRHLPRQDGNLAGRIAGFEFYVSTDGLDWGTAVATGTLSNVATESTVFSTIKTGRYVRFRALGNYDAYGFAASLAEFNLLTDNRPPESTISTPTDSVTIAAGETVTFNGSGSDPDGHTPLTYHWSFGTGSGAPDSSAQNPGAIRFNTPGTYTVRFTTIDSLGQADPTPATRTITVLNAGPTVIPRTGWSVVADSQETTQVSFAGTGHATRAIDGNVYTMWHTRYKTAQPPPPHDLIIDLATTRTIAGFRHLPGQDGNQNNRIAEFEFYVSPDGTNWGSPVATGRFPNTQEETEVLFPPVNGRFVRLRALNNQHGSLFSAIAEFNVLQASTAPNSAPNGSIVSPSSNITIPAGAVVDFAGSATDPEGQPLSYRWTFGPGSGIADSRLQNPGLVRFNFPGTYVVSLHANDNKGLVDPTPATRTITVEGWQPLSRTGWSLHYTDSEELASGSWGPATPASNAFDGNPSTFWHTEWFSTIAPLPHELQINLGATHELAGLTYLPRQDGVSNGKITHFEFYLSTDGVNWGDPIAAGVFPNSSTIQQVTFPKQAARYIRLRALGEVNGNPATAVAEFGALLPPSTTPSVRLISPHSKHLQTSSTLIARADANVQPGQGVRFTLNGTTSVDDYTAPYEATFNGLSGGGNQVEVFIINPSGNIVPGIARYDRASQIGIGDYIVALGDSITYGFGDDITSDNTSADGRNSSAGYTPILASALSAARGRPVAIFNEGIGGENSAQAAARIWTVVQKHPDAQRFLIMYGANDVFVPRASGLGLDPGDAGYAGSFKDYMQQIIDVVIAAGKTPALALTPPIEPVGGAYDLLLQAYNQVVLELAADPDNQISVVPPDLHTYFATRIPTHYIPDAIHPNGLGYQSIAQLWLNALE